jgi:hypothetical protein
MAYNPVYANTTNDKGERVSTNAYWTGHQVGTAMQDVTVGATTQPYAVEERSVHVGTVLRDAADAKFPEVAE